MKNTAIPFLPCACMHLWIEVMMTFYLFEQIRASYMQFAIISLMHLNRQNFPSRRQNACMFTELYAKNPASSYMQSQNISLTLVYGIYISFLKVIIILVYLIQQVNQVSQNAHVVYQHSGQLRNWYQYVLHMILSAPCLSFECL